MSKSIERRIALSLVHALENVFVYDGTRQWGSATCKIKLTERDFHAKMPKLCAPCLCEAMQHKKAIGKTRRRLITSKGEKKERKKEKGLFLFSLLFCAKRLESLTLRSTVAKLYSRIFLNRWPYHCCTARYGSTPASSHRPKLRNISASLRSTGRK